MSEPFLWGSPIDLPSGIYQPHVTALANGTFLVIGKVWTTPESVELRTWIYNADGSLKQEKNLAVPDVGPWNSNFLGMAAINPVAVELPDGRIGITWSVQASSGGAPRNVWLGLYGADLEPLGPPQSIAGFQPTEPYAVGEYRSDDITSLSDGRLIVTYLSYSGEAFFRIRGTDGVLSDPVSLGATAFPTSSYPYQADDFTSVTDLATLTNGKVAVVLRVNETTNHIRILDPSAAGGSSLSDPISIPVMVNLGLKSLEVTALAGSGFVVTWVEMGKAGAAGSEPIVTVKYQVYNASGTPIDNEPAAFYASSTEAASVGAPNVLALPGGGFALAAQVVPIFGHSNMEVRLSIFDAAGQRASDKLLVSKPAAEGEFSLNGLSMLADGRIAVHLSSGIQIVDPRDEAIMMKGTAGNDHYIGTAFNDTFDGSAGVDRLDGGNGIDFVSFATAKAGVTASLSGGMGGDAAGDTYISIEGLLGSSFADVFTGNGSAILKGRGGDDTYFTKAGDTAEESPHEGRDTVVSNGSYALKADAEIEFLKISGLSAKTSANLTGSNTANEIVGHGGRNALRGLDGNDVLKASSGNDTLKGDAGSDRLHGGAGNDKLYGGTGTGRDVFVFDTKPNKTSNVDRIYDFNPKYDSIQLENKVFTKLGKGSTKGVKFKADMFVKGDAAKDQEDRIIYDNKTGALCYDQDGTGSKAQVKIATLSKNLKLTHHDFFVI